MEDRDRDKFYAPLEPPADDEEYELEPLDPAVVDREKRQAEHVAEQVRASIDIDEVYRQSDRSRGEEIVASWAQNFHYRFHIKHLLFATAGLAIAIAAAKLGFLVQGLLVLVIGTIGGLYLYLSWHDRQQQAEAEAKREKMYAERRRQQMHSSGKPPLEQRPKREEPVVIATPSTLPADMWDEPPAPEPVRIHFSLRTLFIAMTVAAVIFGLISVLGAGPMATILGFVAVAGLVVHAIGFAPPQSVIFGWWFILFLYVLLTIANWISVS